MAAYNEGERVMKERERGKGQGEEGGLLASRFSWWVLGELVGAAPLKRTVGSMMVLYCTSTRTFFHPSSQFSALLFQLREYLLI